MKIATLLKIVDEKLPEPYAEIAKKRLAIYKKRAVIPTAILETTIQVFVADSMIYEERPCDLKTMEYLADLLQSCSDELPRELVEAIVTVFNNITNTLEVQEITDAFYHAVHTPLRQEEPLN